MTASSTATRSVTAQAWAIRRSLADLRGVAVMAITWRECYTRARNAQIIAARKAAYEAEQAEYDARLHEFLAPTRAVIAAHPDSAFAEDWARSLRA